MDCQERIRLDEKQRRADLRHLEACLAIRHLPLDLRRETQNYVRFLRATLEPG